MESQQLTVCSLSGKRLISGAYIYAYVRPSSTCCIVLYLVSIAVAVVFVWVPCVFCLFFLTFQNFAFLLTGTPKDGCLQQRSLAARLVHHMNHRRRGVSRAEVHLAAARSTVCTKVPKRSPRRAALVAYHMNHPHRGILGNFLPY